ncbi:MAG: hypothetical protein ABW166_09625 [Sedimenticola sp.]
MASFKVVFPDGSPAKNTKVDISFDNGGMASGITDSRGYVSVSGSSTYGKVFVRGRQVHSGSLNIGEVIA